MKVVIYRNLNVIKKDPTAFIWTVCEVSGNRGRGKKFGYIVPDQFRHLVKDDEKHMILASAIALANPVAVCQEGTLKRIREDNVRSVGAWVIGDWVDSFNGQGHRFTMNPLGSARGGRGDTDYKWSSDKVTSVNWATVKGCRFSQVGAEAILS